MPKEKYNAGDQKTISRLMAVAAIYAKDVTGELDVPYASEDLHKTAIASFRAISEHMAEELQEDVELEEISIEALIARARAKKAGDAAVQDTRPIPPDDRFFKKLTIATSKLIATLDAELETFTNEAWSYARVNPIAKALLRTAMAERTQLGTDIGIIKTQYRKLSESLLESHERPFVDAVLHAVLKD